MKTKNSLFVLLTALGLMVSLATSAHAATGTLTEYSGPNGWIWTNPANGVCVNFPSTVVQVVNKTDRTVALWRYTYCSGGAQGGVAAGTTWNGNSQNPMGSFMPQ